MIGSEQVIASESSQHAREHSLKVFDRQDVRAQLQSKEGDVEAARARVNALTDDEVASINGKSTACPLAVISSARWCLCLSCC